MNFSFAGCGFLGIYHVGVAACLKKYAPNLLVNKISGASAGALAAVCLLCDSPLGTITSSVLKTATEARKHTLGPFSPTFNVEKLLREGLLSVLPDDAHRIVSGKLFISVTRVSDGKNILLSQFNTREELIQAILCSAFIPGFSGWAPVTFRGVRYADGGFSDNLPCLDPHTVTVSPFCGESDICPRDSSGPPVLQGLLCSAFIPGFSGWACPRVRGVRYVDGGFTNNLPEVDHGTVTVSPFCGESDICPKDTTTGLVTVNLANTSIELSKENLYRFARILFPPPPEVLSKMCQQGFNDALDFLQRNNLINCTRCLAVQSSFNLTESREEARELVRVDHFHGPDDNCIDCKQQRKEAILDQLPEAVGSILQDAITSANEGLMNWVFKHKSMKLLSVLTLPYVLPMDIAYSAFLRFMATAPTSKDLQSLAQQVITLVKALLRMSTRSSLHHHHRHLDTKFSCQLAITQFSGDVEMQHIQNRQNFDFTLDLDTMEGVPQSHKDAMLLESQALAEVALRCASRSVSRAGSRMASRVQSRAPSRAPSRAVSRAVSRRPSFSEEVDTEDSMSSPAAPLGEDAFERILDVTTHQEALMAYYYLDDNNEVRVTEIFDMTNADEELDVSGDAGHYLTSSSPHWASVHPHQRFTSLGSEEELEDERPAGDGCEMSPLTPSDTESEYCRRHDHNNPESEQMFGTAGLV
ncbi:patatin-like phospholipase domain-containing protein 2 isoform X2 [Portunus trituberculatus]|uniref:patatin-like phospholipase domain-containing protein 2 isoform X2 n=1 Tax=Portunus trituberculatus TaxID=210409 RepID=UPI001E1CF6C7|nr:patatin-like phospholipase domain-containing protein 2 isoform X2 [Portunus trituberculatus]